MRGATPQGRGRLRRRVRRAVVLLAVVGLVAALAPLLPLAAPAEPRLDRKLQPPCLPVVERGFHPGQMPEASGITRALIAARCSLLGDLQLAPVLGTDALGRCVLSRIVWGARLSLLVGLTASLISLLIGVAYGATSGYAGGRTDEAMMRLVDVLYSLPLMFIVIFVVAFLRGFQSHDPGFPLGPRLALFAVIGAVSWLVMARLIRAQVVTLRKAPFVEAARLAGSGPLAVLRRHLLPNLAPLVLVALTLTVPRVILLEAFLSFLGLGVQPPHVSWGLLARQGFDAVTAVHVSWWLIVFPGLAMGLALHALNTLGDGMRDLLDPALQGAEASRPLEGRA